MNVDIDKYLKELVPVPKSSGYTGIGLTSVSLWHDSPHPLMEIPWCQIIIATDAKGAYGWNATRQTMCKPVILGCEQPRVFYENRVHRYKTKRP